MHKAKILMHEIVDTNEMKGGNHMTKKKSVGLGVAAVAAGAGMAAAAVKKRKKGKIGSRKKGSSRKAGIPQHRAGKGSEKQ